MSGGVEVNAERYGINPNNKLYRNIEAGASAAANISGVRIQDGFTKSQMFMTEMDKYMRINKNTTLKEAILNGEEPDLEIYQGALDSTLKSVFSKDYTTWSSQNYYVLLLRWLKLFLTLQVLVRFYRLVGSSTTL